MAQPIPHLSLGHSVPTLEWEPFARTRRADAMNAGRALAILFGRSSVRLQHIWAGNSRSNLQGSVNEKR